MEDTKKVVLLRRVSTTMQADLGESLASQQVALENYCTQKGLTNIVKDFELVESSTRGQRKEFLKAIDFCKKTKGCTVLVSLKVDRMFRNFENFPDILRLVKAEMLELHFVQENMTIHKNSNANDMTILGLGVVMAQNVALATRDHVIRGMDFCATEKGACMNRVPCGYRNITTQDGKADVIIDEERGDLVKKLFEYHSTGLYTLSSLAEECKKWGLTSRETGKPLVISTISSMLKNRFYYGEMKYKGEWHTHRYEKLITKTTYDKCQAVFESKKKGETPKFKYGSLPFVFRGLMKCGNCGCSITSYNRKKPSGKEYNYLRCSHYRGNCEQKEINEKIALMQVEDTLKTLRLDNEIMQHIRADMESIIDKQNEYQRQQLKKLRTKYDECQSKIKRLRDLLLKGTIDSEDYRDMSDELKGEQYKLNEDMNSLTHADERFSLALSTVLSLGSSAYNIFSSSKVETKRGILDIVLSNCQLNGQEISYDLRKPFDWVRSLNEKTPSKMEGVQNGDPNGN